MEYIEEMAEAAHRASDASYEAMEAYRDGTVTEEPEITGGLATMLRSHLNRPIGGLRWSAHVLKHSKGIAAEEKKVGADLLIHVQFRTQNLKFSKGVLVQGKRQERNARMPPSEHERMVEQCNLMLSRTPASFVFDYATQGMRCGSALAIAGSSNLDLYDQCVWTPFRFFLELFRCPIGDRAITSAKVEDLPDPIVLKLTASGGRRR